MDRWTDRVVLVTGASSGIGKSIVAELSNYPLKIVALDQKTDLIQKLVDELQSSTAKIYPVQCDLISEPEILKVFKWIEITLGQGVSVTINNANIFTETKILEGETDDWRHMFGLNVLAVSTCCRESYRSMTKHGIVDGLVININSTAGFSLLSSPKQKVYNSTKTALTYITEGFRHELVNAGSKIKVTSINPGKVAETEISVTEENTKRALFMKPERVAQMVIIAMVTPSDVVIADLTVLSVGETIQEYPPPMIRV